MKLKDLLACAATGMILCTSCIKNEAPNAEADILNCTLPEGIRQMPSSTIMPPSTEKSTPIPSVWRCTTEPISPNWPPLSS